MTPENNELLARLRAVHQNVVAMETEQGLLAVKRPSSKEMELLEDVIGRLADYTTPPDPLAGIDEALVVIVSPEKPLAERLLQERPGMLEQVHNLARIAGSIPDLRAAEPRDDEFYREPAQGEEGKQKRNGGLIVVAEHDPRCKCNACSQLQPEQQRERYVLRLLGLVEHRQLVRDTEQYGFNNRRGREASHRTLGDIGRSHVLLTTGGNGSGQPSFDAVPLLACALGMAVRDGSGLRVGARLGKSEPA